MITPQELSTIQSKAPLLSEGAISPFQVSNMSKREKAEREKNIQIRYKAEAEFKEQNMTDEEKKIREELILDQKRQSRINQIQSQMRAIKDFPQMKSKRDNALKRTYRMYETELEGLEGGNKD